MLIVLMLQSHLLNDYSTKAMTNEDQWTMFSLSLLLGLRLMGVAVVGANVTSLR